jgi:hypothetical protein
VAPRFSIVHTSFNTPSSVSRFPFLLFIFIMEQALAGIGRKVNDFSSPQFLCKERSLAVFVAGLGVNYQIRALFY